ncbi:MAG: iron chaperone [Terriglobales bacterium]
MARPLRGLASRFSGKFQPSYEKANPPKTVDDYLAKAPKEAQAKLVQLRKVIKAAAPKADEGISYGMPYYGYLGRLVYFQLWKKHIGLYVPTPIIEEHKKELDGYQTTKATIRLPIEKPLPVALIKKLIRARIKKNEAGRGK